ncbi:MAG: MATE family efflux transporter [Myxococcota bacterium]
MSALTLPAGSIRPAHVRALAWPVLVSMVSMSAMAVADTLFTGWLGTSQLAGVGLATTLSFFVITPGRGILRGVKILTAQCTGAEDHLDARRLLVQVVWLALPIGAALMLLAPAGEWLFWILGASAEVGVHARDYFVVRVLFAPVALLVWGVEGWFQGRGDTRTPMVASVLSNALNVALDPLLIFGLGVVPALGVAGAAWATVASQGVGLVFLLWRASRHLGVGLGPDWPLLRRTFALGVPLAVQWTLDFGGFIVFLSLLAQSGDAELAAHVLVFRIVMISMLPGFSLADATGVLVGQAVGARRGDAVRQAWWAGTWQALLLMGAFGILFLIVPTWLLWPFSPESEVAEIAIVLLWIAAMWQLTDAVVMVNITSLTSAGDTRFTLLMSVGASWFVQVPLSILLVWGLEMGAVGAWLALTVEITVVAVVSFLRVRGRGWLESKFAADASAEVVHPPVEAVAIPAK